MDFFMKSEIRLDAKAKIIIVENDEAIKSFQ